MQCTGPCSQGDVPCPTPEACQLAEQERSKWSPLLNVALILVGFGLLASVLWCVDQVGALLRSWIH
jgi:hypothetical protein